MEDLTSQNPHQSPAPDSRGECFISLAEAIERTKIFRNDYISHIFNHHERIKSNYFSKEKVMKVLSQPGCAGIRVYNTVRPKVDKDAQTGEIIDRRDIVIVGTDAEGNDILKKNDYKGGTGCNPFSVFMVVPASSHKDEDALLLGNPDPCPELCGKPNELNGGPK